MASVEKRAAFLIYSREHFNGDRLCSNRVTTKSVSSVKEKKDKKTNKNSLLRSLLSSAPFFMSSPELRNPNNHRETSELGLSSLSVSANSARSATSASSEPPTLAPVSLLDILYVRLVAVAICVRLQARDVGALRNASRACRDAIDSAVGGLSLAWSGKRAVGYARPLVG